MTKCKFYNECKNQQLYVGIATNVKNQWILWKLYASITRNVKKNLATTMDPYAGIATNEEYQRLFVTYMRVLQGMQNANGYYGTHMHIAKCQRLLWDLYGGIAMNAKCLWLFLDLYASIAYLKMVLWSS
jgi:hypothetical protein